MGVGQCLAVSVCECVGVCLVCVWCVSARGASVLCFAVSNADLYPWPSRQVQKSFQFNVLLLLPECQRLCSGRCKVLLLRTPASLPECQRPCSGRCKVLLLRTPACNSLVGGLKSH